MGLSMATKTMTNVQNALGSLFLPFSITGETSVTKLQRPTVLSHRLCSVTYHSTSLPAWLPGTQIFQTPGNEATLPSFLHPVIPLHCFFFIISVLLFILYTSPHLLLDFLLLLRATSLTMSVGGGRQLIQELLTIGKKQHS